MAEHLADVAAPPTSPAPLNRPQDRRAAILATALLLPICLVYLWFPGDGDQTLFELGARQLQEGAAFYRDFWDIKQPGIYWFFQLGDTLGPGVIGPRLLELAGVALGGWLVWRLAGAWRVHTVVRVVAPALVIGSYVLLAHRDGVTQIEGLINPWLLALIALTWPADPAGGRVRAAHRWALAGAITGAVGVFKLFYLPVPAVLLLGALIASHASGRDRLARIGAAAAGFAVPIGATVLYFALHGDLGLLRVTTLLPLESVDQVPLSEGWHRWKDLVVNPILPLAAIGVLTARRRGTMVREVTLVLTALTVWVLSLPQYPGPYRLLMLAAPCGLLAVAGADVLWRSVSGRRFRQVAVVAVAVVLSVPMLWGPWRLVSNAGQIPWGLGEDARNRRDFVLLNEPHDRQAEPVRDLVRPGTAIYVFGHPQIYEELDGHQAVPVSGWNPDGMPRRVWRERDRELMITRPEYVFVEAQFETWVRQMSPSFSGLLSRDYTVVSSTSDGVWYHTDETGPQVTNTLDRQHA